MGLRVDAGVLFDLDRHVLDTETFSEPGQSSAINSTILEISN
jgi:hypothetical protein